MTSTTDATLDVARGTLTLVTVSEDYRVWPGAVPEDRTFYATASTFDDDYVTIVVPETDDRHVGMWALSGPSYGLELDGPHRGWNVSRNMVQPYAATPADTTPDTYAVGDRVEVHGWPGGEWDGPATVAEDRGGDHVSVIPDAGEFAGLRGAFPRENIRPLTDTRPRPASADLSETDRRALPVEEAYPVGSVWNHSTYGDMPVTITGHRGETEVQCDYPGRTPGEGEPAYVQADGRVGQFWPRGAFDSRGTVVGWADDGAPSPAVETTPETFTSGGDADSTTAVGAEERTYSREDVDKAVQEALDTFKREANRIAVQYAEDNGLCSQFERAMDDIGLLGRDEWHEQENDDYRVTFTVSVVARGRDEDDAEDRARAELYDSLPYPFDQTIEHHSTTVLD